MDKSQYIAREVDGRIKEWSESGGRGLMILGARQVGKTESITYFLSEFYKTEDERLLPILDLTNDAIRAAIRATDSINGFTPIERALAEANILMDVPENGFVVIDEVQRLCDREREDSSLMAERIRRLLSDRFRVIFSGSLLGATISGIDKLNEAIPDLTIFRMYPFTFCEFVAQRDGDGAKIDQARNALISGKSLSPNLHIHFLERFAEYCFVGGMPASVLAYRKSSQNIKASFEAVKYLASLYEEDILKYFNEDHREPLRGHIFDDIIRAIHINDKKLVMREYEDTTEHRHLFDYIIDSDIGLLVPHVDECGLPVEKQEKPKAYLVDVGFFHEYVYRICSNGGLDLEPELKRYFDRRSLEEQIDGYREWIRGENPSGKPNDYGAFFEQIVAQELKARGYPLAYSYTSGKCENELEFIFPDDLSAIDVKSGDIGGLASAMSHVNGGKDFYLLSLLPFIGSTKDGRYRTLPVYAVSFLTFDELKSIPFEPLGKNELEVLQSGRLPQTPGFFPIETVPS